MLLSSDHTRTHSTDSSPAQQRSTGVMTGLHPRHQLVYAIIPSVVDRTEPVSREKARFIDFGPKRAAGELRRLAKPLRRVSIISRRRSVNTWPESRSVERQRPPARFEEIAHNWIWRQTDVARLSSRVMSIRHCYEAVRRRNTINCASVMARLTKRRSYI